MNISLYDFDGTIYRGDSSVDYALHCILRRPYLAPLVIVVSFLVALHKCGLVKKETAKALLFMIMSPADVSIRTFVKKIRNKFNQETLAMMGRDIASGIMPIVISAGPRLLVESAVQSFAAVTVIATETDPRHPWRLRSPNCSGEEKVRRLREWLAMRRTSLGEVRITHVVSDSLDDIPLFQLGERCYFVRGSLIRNGLPAAKSMTGRGRFR